MTLHKASPTVKKDRKRHAPPNALVRGQPEVEAALRRFISLVRLWMSRPVGFIIYRWIEKSELDTLRDREEERGQGADLFVL